MTITGERHLAHATPDGQEVATAGPVGHRPPLATLGGRSIQQSNLEREAVPA
jgi:hypothetical protein